MKITDHFDLEEFVCRDGTPYPEQWIEERLRPLCVVLEVVRFEVGGGHRPLLIVSGYRTDHYNALIGGAPRSQHPKGRAVDFTIPGVKPFIVQELVQKIDEAGRIRIGGLGRYAGFTHIDIRPRAKSAPLVTWSAPHLAPFVRRPGGEQEPPAA
jgi:zinc D-Ala-D-Ala carboxypeptidase